MKITVTIEANDNDVINTLRKIVEPFMPKQNPTADEICDTWSREEAAKYYKKSEKTISAWFRDGKLKGYAVGRSLRIYKNQLAVA